MSKVVGCWLLGKLAHSPRNRPETARRCTIWACHTTDSAHKHNALYKYSAALQGTESPDLGGCSGTFCKLL